MSFSKPRRSDDRTRTRAGVPDYNSLKKVLSSANMFASKPLDIVEQLEKSKQYKGRLLENFQKIHQGVRKRVELAASGKSRSGVDGCSASAIAVATDSNGCDDNYPPIPQSPTPHEIPTQSSGYGSQESPKSSTPPTPQTLR